MTMLTPDDIALLLKREGSEGYPGEASDSEAAVQRRTQLLAPVLATCQLAWDSSLSVIDLLAEKIGDGSRDVAWRVPFGESGILEFFIRFVALDGISPTLHLHALRIVGNSCADTDVNRGRVVEGNHLVAIVHRLQDESLIPFTVPVLYNILVDYEPAQIAASKALLNQQLITLLQSPNLTNYTPFVTYFCKILFLLSGHESEATVAHPSTVPILLRLALQPPFSSDADDFVSLASSAAAYLAGAKFQEAMVQGDDFGFLLDAYRHSLTAFDINQLDDSDSADALKQLRSALLTSLSDISANDNFPVHHPLGSSVPQTLLQWLQVPNNALISAACLALGNISRSDEASLALVQTHRAHEPLIALLSNPEIGDPQVLHASLSFLKNLAIPAPNKELLSGLLDSSCIPRIFTLDTLPQVQFSAISLTRLLLVNCVPNVKLVCARLSSDTASPAHDRSTVHAMTTLFTRTDAEPTKLEAARSVAVVCRALHSNPAKPILPEWDPEQPEDREDDSKRREEFYSRHDVGLLLAFLVTQEKWPILRSEAWFVLALMSRSKDGAGLLLSLSFRDRVTGAIYKAILGSEEGADDVVIEESQAESLPAPEETIFPTGGGVELEPQQVDPKQKDQMERIDRENCVVMCKEMLRSLGTEFPELRQSRWEELVKEGTALLIKEKGGQ
ncbi:unnamed protein product [Clonostachys solani]|uniref:Uncharacterized protein n=1 Tax=Clonostachys solani TaxID=160281 RepID=A0A9N9ZCB8_9HYPO|nr:unnamed protein product [Clonostachys solani]